MRTRSLWILTIFVSLLTTVSFAEANDTFTISHRGSERRGFRLSAMAIEETKQDVGTVRLYKKSFLDNYPVASTEIEIGLEGDELYAIFLPQGEEHIDKNYIKIGDATELDDIRLFPGVEIEAQSPLTSVRWSTKLTLKEGARTQSFHGKPLRLPAITARILENLRKQGSSTDSKKTVSVLVSMLSCSFERLRKPDFSADLQGEDSVEKYVQRTHEYYLTPIKLAAQELSGRPRKTLRKIHRDVTATALHIHLFVSEWVEFTERAKPDELALRSKQDEVLTQVVKELKAIEVVLSR